jgi:murein DD-endopeptidase MepM/ murein hydrolase activator NlpD
MAGAVAAALLAHPGSLRAVGSSTGDPWSDRGKLQPLQELLELQVVQERLQRSQALQGTLRDRIRATTAKVEAVRERHEQVSVGLRSQGQQASALERRLDQLVPRLLARAAEARERRARTAQALAELASKSRSVRLDSTTRARMLAISPLMFKQLRGVDRGPAALRRAEQTIRRHAQIERRRSELLTEQRRLSSELEQRRRQQRVALARLRGLDAKVQLLGDEQTRLARRLEHAEAAITVRAEPQAAEPALSDRAAMGAGQRGIAVVKGAFGWQRQLAGAERRSVFEVPAGAQVPGTVPGLPNPRGQPAWPTMSQAARSLAAARQSEPAQVWPSDAGDALGQPTPLNVVFRSPAGALGEGAMSQAGYRGRPPLLPMAEGLPGRTPAVDDPPEMAFATMPGQRVATPVDGEVVFAGRFKSYGLLLIIEHEREYHTLLWGFARLDVSPGVGVRIGQVVGIMGAESAGPPVLYVERRRHGRPINLAARSSGIRG